MAAPDFWNNQEKAREVVAELKGLKAVLKPLEEAVKAAGDLATLVEMAQEDDDLAAEVPGELSRLEQAVEVLETKALLSGPLDANPALLTINARDGGTDANDWAEMLLADVSELGQGPRLRDRDPRPPGQRAGGHQ